MKVFLVDFIIYNDMDSHLSKLKLWFEEHGSIKPKKMCFHVFFRIIMGFIIFKERKLPDPQKIEAIVNMLILTNPQ